MDLRSVEPGGGCSSCGAPVEIRKTVEIGILPISRAAR